MRSRITLIICLLFSLPSEAGAQPAARKTAEKPLILAGPGVAAGARCDHPVELLDLYPTLVELSGLPEKSGLDGHSLVRLLKNPRAAREWPVITTANQNNHSVRSERWRYIRYADGAEELYDHRHDPHEWTNLARNPRYAAVIREHVRWLPRVNQPPVRGSAQRLLVNEQGVWLWEGKPIRAEEKEP